MKLPAQEQIEHRRRLTFDRGRASVEEREANHAERPRKTDHAELIGEIRVRVVMVMMCVSHDRT